MNHAWVFKSLVAIVLFVIGTFMLKISNVDSLTASLFLGLVYGVLALAWLLVSRKQLRTIVSIDAKTIWMISGFAFIFFIATILYFSAIKEASNPGYVRALMSLEIAGMVLISYLVLNERVQIVKLSGVALIIAGSAVVALC